MHADALYPKLSNYRTQPSAGPKRELEHKKSVHCYCLQNRHVFQVRSFSSGQQTQLHTTATIAAKSLNHGCLRNGTVLIVRVGGISVRAIATKWSTTTQIADTRENPRDTAPRDASFVWENIVREKFVHVHRFGNVQVLPVRIVSSRYDNSVFHRGGSKMPALCRHGSKGRPRLFHRVQYFTNPPPMTTM